MSKPVKALLRKELVRRLTGVDSLAVVSLMGLDGVATNRLRRELRTKDIRVTVVKNSVARAALKELGLDPAVSLVEGPCAIAAGADSVVTIVRELLVRTKDMPALMVRGALMEGVVFPAEKVLELSKYPTRAEAISGIVMLARSPGARLAGAIRAPAGLLAGIVKAVREKKEKEEPPPPAEPAQPSPEPTAPGGAAPLAAAEGEKPAAPPAPAAPVEP